LISKTKFVSILLFILFGIASNHLFAWGWEAHRYINEHAVDCLPTVMANFIDQQEFLTEHAVDPDQDSNPGYYHYIDIDYYPEYAQGTLPHDFNALVSEYGYDTVINNGTVPWVIAEWTDSLTHLMEREEWNTAFQVAAELGHYVADSHQPLHLTMNYNGQNTGNYGVHSRYETSMINPHLPDLTPPDSAAHYWQNPLNSIFLYIDGVYPYVDDIMAADDYADSQDPSHGDTYYSLMWDALDTLTIDAIDRAIVDLASIWYTAWVNAGNPPAGTDNDWQQPQTYTLHQNYPNPFNPVTTIAYELPVSAPIRLVIYDLTGREVWRYYASNQTVGTHRILWNGKNTMDQPVSAGVYFYALQSGDFREVKKLVCLK